MSTRSTLILPGTALHPNPKKRGVILTESAISVIDEFARESKTMTDNHVRKMVTLAWRFGYRCALVDCVPAPWLVSAEKVIDRARFYLDDTYEEMT